MPRFSNGKKVGSSLQIGKKLFKTSTPESYRIGLLMDDYQVCGYARSSTPGKMWVIGRKVRDLGTTPRCERCVYFSENTPSGRTGYCAKSEPLETKLVCDSCEKYIRRGIRSHQRGKQTEFNGKMIGRYRK